MSDLLVISMYLSRLFPIASTSLRYAYCVVYLYISCGFNQIGITRSRACVTCKYFFVTPHTDILTTNTTLPPSILPPQPPRHHVYQHRQRLQCHKPLQIHVRKPPQRIIPTPQEPLRCHRTAKPWLHASRRISAHRPRRRSQDWHAPIHKLRTD